MLGIWWPTLFHGANAYVKMCDEYQRYKAPNVKDKMPLILMIGARAFTEWDIDFIRPINPTAKYTQS